VEVEESVVEVENQKKEKSRNSEKIDAAILSSEADVSASNSSDATVKVSGNTADIEKEVNEFNELVKEVEKEKKEKSKNSKQIDVAILSSETDVSASNSSDATVEVGGSTADIEKDVTEVNELVKEVENPKKERSKNSDKIDVVKLSLEADVSARNSIDATVEVGSNTADIEKDVTEVKKLVAKVENEKNEKKVAKLSSEADVSAKNSSDATVEVCGITADAEKDCIQENMKINKKTKILKQLILCWILWKLKPLLAIVVVQQWNLEIMLLILRRNFI
jgi:hypothetical protein